MALQRLELLPVLEADDVIGHHGFLDRNLRLEFFAFRKRVVAGSSAEGGVRLIDSLRYVACENRVVAYVSLHYLCRQLDQLWFGTIFHAFSPFTRSQPTAYRAEILDVIKSI